MVDCHPAAERPLQDPAGGEPLATGALLADVGAATGEPGLHVGDDHARRLRTVALARRGGKSVCGCRDKPKQRVLRQYAPAGDAAALGLAPRYGVGS